MKAHSPGSRALRRWLRTGLLAAALPLALVSAGVTAPVHNPAAERTNGGWAGALWLGSSTGTTNTTLAHVRSVIGANTTSTSTLTGAGVGIALIDTGVAPVPGLPAAQIVNGPDLSFESQSNALRYHDTYGHGTHLAGIIVANDTATGTKGLAPKAKVTSIKVGISNGAADVTQMIAAIDWVVKNRNHDPANPIKILNLSYGTGGTPSYLKDPLQFAVEQAWLAGITVIVAGGNNGNNTASLTNPATDPHVIAVGSSATANTTSTSDDTLSTFSNLSTTSRSLDLLAPGQSIASLRVEGSHVDLSYPEARVGTTLMRGSGSSQSAAVVSAAAALLLEKRPTLTPDQVKQALVGSAVPLQVGLGASKGLKQVNVHNALSRTVTTTAQSWAKSTGDGDLNLTRGGAGVTWHDGTKLDGARSIFGPFDPAAWAVYAKQRVSWDNAKPGVWMGSRMAGDGWTGSSWASKTWGAAAWPGTPWMGGTSWQDPDWSGRYWAGRYWAGRYWASSYWSTNDWSSFWG
ncbi:MAG TPA: S8 family serine peptidase [Pilimelia sp.]|nr:S8 family serine peptidase [Pilimelia sp.]